MMTKIDPIRIIMGSDYHFGAPEIDQEEMATAFAETIFPLLPETDLFCINGDFFDTLVNFNNHGFDPIYDVILNLFALCEKHQVTLRVLQGTYQHDRNQCKRLEAFYRNNNATFNFKFIFSIDLDEVTIRDRTLRFFYIPDDLPYKSSDDIVDVLNSKLLEKGWDYVDYGCIHGFFDFTFPTGISQDNRVVFKETQFPFVKKAIDVGHVHQHRIVGKVFSNGSFDRLNHGDEDPKGCIRFLDYPDHYTANFIRNNHAAIYDTLTFDIGDTTETLSTKIETHLKSLSTKRKINLRFVTHTPEQYDIIRLWMKEYYPDVKIRRKKPNEKVSGPMFLSTSQLMTPIEKRVAPTIKTLSSFVRNRMPDDYSLSIEDIEGYLELSTS